MSLALLQLVPAVVAQTDHEKCVSALLLAAEIGGNNRLNKDPEYIKFLNELSDYQHEFVVFDELPSSLQMNFQIYQDSEGIIDISGVTHGDEATDQQQRIVETLCKTTTVVLEGVQLPEQTTSSISNTTTTTSDESEEETLFPTAMDTDMDTDVDAVMDSDPSETTAEKIEESLVDATNEVPVQATTDAPETAAEVPTGSNTAEVERPPIGSNTASVIRPSDAALAGNETEVPLELSGNTTENTNEGLNDTVPSIILNQTAGIAQAVGNFTSESNATAFVTNSSTIAPDESETTSPMVSFPNSTAAPIPVPSQPSNETAFSQSTNETAGAEDTQPAVPVPTQDPFAACKLVMRFSDINADDTMNKLEYVWFINDNWKNPFPGVAFKNLPQALKDNFNRLATEGAIDISVMNSEEEMTEEQEAFLDKICADTGAVLAQEPDEPNAGEEATMATFKDCLVSITMFDENSDAFLDESEYVALIREVTNDKFGKQGFSFMPTVLQEAFDALSTSGSIDLGGAKHEEKLTSSQQEGLEEICIEASYALEEASRGSGEEGPKFDGADTDTMLEYAACFLGMTAYDQDGNSGLDQYEYVGLVNHLGKNGFQDLGFSELPEVIQENFFKLETNGTIDITGSQTDQTPDNIQTHFLGRVCIETTAAVNMGLEYPTSSNGGISVDAAISHTIVVHSSFNIFSDVWIPEEEFATGSTRKTLEEAYKIFVIEVVEGLIQEGSSQGSTQRRKLEEVTFDPESPEIYHMMDLNCAGGAQDSICKTVFAQYEITAGEDMDREALYEEFVSVTQGFIDSGLLQRDMEQIHPEILVTVIGASEPVVFQGEDSTQSPVNSVPFNSKTNAEDGSDSSKKKTIALVAVAVACILLGGLVALFYVRRQEERRMASAGGSLPGKSSQKASDTDSKVDYEEDFLQEGSQASHRSGGSQSTPKSNIFRARGGDTTPDSGEDMNDEELGRMQIIDLANQEQQQEQQEGQREDSASSWEEEESQSNRSFPPLWKKKRNKPAKDTSSAASEELSFAFRRYALDGNKEEPADDGSNVI